MDTEKQPKKIDEKDDVMVKNIFKFFATLAFTATVPFYLFILPVLPLAGDAGISGSIFILTFLAYPVWAIIGLKLLWKNEKPKRWYLVFSLVFIPLAIYFLFFQTP